MSGIGHNLPPGPPSPETVRELLRGELVESISRQQEILAGIERFKATYAEITDDEVSGKAADLAGSKGLINQWLQAMESRRKQEKVPYDAAAAAAHAVFRELMGPVEAGMAEIRELNSAYLRKKEDAVRKVAGATTKVSSGVRGQMGTTPHLQRRWRFVPEKSDLLELVMAIAEGRAPLEYVMFDNVRINRAVVSEKVRTIPGCHIEEQRNAI